MSPESNSRIEACWLSRGGTVLAAALIALGIGLCPRRAGAEVDGRFHVTYSPGPNCPSAQELVAQILARTPKARLSPPSESAHAFELVVSERGSGSSDGRMVIRQGAGAPDTRVVPGGTCAEVVDAMALIAALAIDPLASTNPIVGPPPPHPEAAISALPVPVPSAPAPVAPPRPARPRTPWRWGAHLGFAMSSAPTPSLGLGGLLGGEVVSPWAAGSSMSLDAVWCESASVSTQGGDADFRAFYARLAVVPVRVQWMENGTAGPLFFGEVGQLSGTGSHTVAPKTASIPWGAVGAGVRLDWQPSAPVVLGASGGALLPLTRDSFYFRPDVEAHRIGSLGWAASLDIGIRLP